MPFTLKKRDHIISAVNAKLWKKSHKYDVESPRLVEHAYELDNKNQNTFWRNAIKKEMTNVMVAFEILDDDQELPKNLKELGVHLVLMSRWI